MVSPDLAERKNTSHAEKENTSRAEKVATSKVATEIESHRENSAEEEIREARESLKGTGSRGFRRRKGNRLRFNS